LLLADRDRDGQLEQKVEISNSEFGVWFLPTPTCERRQLRRFSDLDDPGQRCWPSVRTGRSERRPDIEEVSRGCSFRAIVSKNSVD
jgi:hypothetical protein